MNDGNVLDFALRDQDDGAARAPLALLVPTPRLPALAPGDLGDRSLDLPEDLSYEQWLQLGRVLVRMERSVYWALGDWWRYGVETRRYGEMSKPGAKAELRAMMGVSYDTIRRAGQVAAAFESGRRRPDLTYAHHQEVAALPAVDADALLDEAVRAGLSTRDLRDRAQKRRQELRALEYAARPVPELTRPDVRCEVADACALPLDDDSVDLIACSPPYALGVAYADGGDVPADEWLAFMVRWLTEARRVTKVSGRLAVNVPLDVSEPYYRMTFVDTVNAARRAGWIDRQIIDWHEDNTTKGGWPLGSQSSAARPYHVSKAEMIAVFSKGEWAPSSDNPDDMTPAQFAEYGRGPWEISGESRPREGHPAAYPLELPRRLIRYFSRVGDVVLDPFCGSGTTLIAALDLQRQAIGFDRSPTYVASTLRRIAEHASLSTTRA